MREQNRTFFSSLKDLSVEVMAPQPISTAVKQATIQANARKTATTPTADQTMMNDEPATHQMNTLALPQTDSLLNVT